MNFYFDYHAANMLTSRIQAIFTDKTVDESRIKMGDFVCFPFEEAKKKLIEEGWEIIETPVEGFPIALTGRELSKSFGSIDSSRVFYNPNFTLGYNTGGQYMGIVPSYLMSEMHQRLKHYGGNDTYHYKNWQNGILLETTPKRVLYLNHTTPVVKYNEIRNLGDNVNQYFSCEIPHEKYLLYEGDSRYYLTPFGVVRVSDHWVQAKKISFLDGKTGIVYDKPVAGLLVAHSNAPKHSYFGESNDALRNAFFEKEKAKLKRVWFDGEFVELADFHGTSAFIKRDGQLEHVGGDLMAKFAFLI